MPDATIIDLLRDLGPSLSSRIAAELQKNGLKEDAARQRVQRRPSQVRTLDLSFPKRATFLYLAEQWQSSEFWNALAEALEKSNGAYARALWALRARGGLMPTSLFAAASANAPVRGQIGADVIKQRLIDVGLLKEVQLPTAGPCVGFHSATESEVVWLELESKLLAERVLISATKEWARKLGLGSWGAFAMRGDLNAPQVARFEWDLTAPSYLAPLVTWNSKESKPNNGFVVFDVIQANLDEKSVRPFVYKLETMRQMKNLGRCLQFLVADGYTQNALSDLRRVGIVAATTESLFGKEVAEALRQLVTTLTNVASNASDTSKFYQVFNTLSKVEGAAGTLRGALFEFVCADIARHVLGAQKITLNKTYRREGRDVAEIDVRAESGNQIYFIEAKGLLPGNVLSDSEVEDWLHRRVPLVYKETVGNPEFQGRQFTFELWTTGELSDLSKRLVSDMQGKLRKSKYGLNVRYGPELKTMTDKSGDPSLKRVLRQHFLEHPLAIASRRESNVPRLGLGSVGSPMPSLVDLEPSLPSVKPEA